ncbi:MAG TPA: ABC transporter permease [Gemmatimonadaceae bacterium]|nr:ABC transporter permease [Gemmatimonadaceae bacterium]
MRRILFLARAEVLHIVRDRATLAQVLLIPMVQLLVLANAATFQIRDTPMDVVDLDRTSTSRMLVSHFAASGNFRIVERSASYAPANADLLSGKATLVLAIPADFERTLVRDGTAPVQLVLNAEKGAAAGIVQFYASRIIQAYGAELGAQLRPTLRTVRASAEEPAPVRGAPLIDVRTRGWYNPTLDYRHYMVPGILVVVVTIICTLLTAQNIAREKELGTLEQLNVTPITRGQFIAAKLLPFWVLGLLELAMGVAIGWAVFGMPVRGSLLLLGGVAAVYLVAALALGLWISTMVETQQQAMFVTFFVMVIYLLMSGLFTPVDSMPRWVQLLAELNPVKHFVLIARAVLVKGAGPADIAQPFLILAVYGAVVFWLAVRQYRKRSA